LLFSARTSRPLHPALIRQLETCFGRLDDIPADCLPLVELINDSYHQADIDLQAAQRDTEEQVLERTRELESAHAKLRQAQKMEAVGQLAGGIAHDFNNLLTAIMGYCELVLDRVRGDDSLRSDVEEIRKAGQRASRLTRQLLAYSRKQVLQPQVMDLNQVVIELEQMLSRVLREDIRLELQTDPTLAHTKADKGQVEQLLMNLVVNSSDAMPQGGILRIRTANVYLDEQFVRRHAGAIAGAYVSVAVEDTGCGMDPEILAHVFEPFLRRRAPERERDWVSPPCTAS
jgi:signal transduction histidine kinase